MRLAVPQVINDAGLIPFLAQLSSVPTVEAEISLDFSALRWVSPAGLVALAATVKHWQSQHVHRVQFEGIQQCPILGYLQRMDLLRICGVSSTEEFERHPSHGRFVPVRPIVDVDAISKDVAACLAPGGDDLEHPASQLYDLAAYVIGELGANVRQHSRGTGYVAAQVNKGDAMVRIAVADNGHGIRQSFVDAGLAWSRGLSDAAAIRKALEPRVSSKGEPVNQGVGLTLVTGLARLTQAWVLILSGTGIVQMDPDGRINEQSLPSGCFYRGTLVTLAFFHDKLQDFYILLDAAKQEAGLLAKRPISTRFT